MVKRGFNQAPLRCIAGDKLSRVLKEVHAEDCDEQKGGSRLYKQVIHLGYYWMVTEPMSFCRTPWPIYPLVISYLILLPYRFRQLTF